MVSTSVDRLDGLSSSTAMKGPCRVATTGNIVLSGLQTIDGVVLDAGDRVLVKNQSTPSENGIYVADTGPWRRAKDFSRTADVRKGTMVTVADGSTQYATGWIVTSSDPIVIGATAITFVAAYLSPAPATASTLDEVHGYVGGAPRRQTVEHLAEQIGAFLPKGETIVVASLGQSNAAITDDLNWDPPANLYYWNSAWSAAGSELYPVPSNTMMFGWAYAAVIARANPDRTVVVLTVAKGDTKIEAWLPTPPDTDMFAATNSAVNACLTHLGKTRVDYVLWWQGESDYPDNVQEYSADLQAVWFRFFGQSWMSHDTPWTVMAVSEIIPTHERQRVINDQLRRWVDMEPQYRTFVNTNMLAPIYWEAPNNVHMTGAGKVIAGKLAYQATINGMGRERAATPWQTVVKRADEARPSTAILANDGELGFWMRAGFAYKVRGSFVAQIYTASAFQWQLVGPAGSLALGVAKTYTMEDPTDPPAVLLFNDYPGTQVIAPSANPLVLVEFEMTFYAVSPAGWCGLKWAQNSGGAQNTTVLRTAHMDFLESFT